MQVTLRALGLTLLLSASMGSAFAMDQSATEETNCLAACDANSENCMAGASTHKPFSPAKLSSRETGSSLGLRRTTKLSQIGHGVASEAKERQR
ncbi:hypothetical protein JQ628_03970 [Bradyrhizobium lablabi]|uniref:hypothetical protein n=1 Tax=Bradyrhizobium lablabi TaxID=722472 RepID=UPI001BAC4BC1|nr:hypothetical protein [Bradyrhizobium lablabi]MBR1120661.1 hypothetical protein [Bradyrhizobium lablabi]